MTPDDVVNLALLYALFVVVIAGLLMWVSWDGNDRGDR